MRVLTRPNLGGPTRQAIALWHAHRALGVPTLLVTGAVGPDEAMLSPADHGVPLLGPGEVLRFGPEATGWVVVPTLGRGLAPWRDFRAGRTLRALVEAHCPDVIHTHTSKAGWLGRTAARGRAPVLAHTFHGHVLADYFGSLFSSALTRLEARLARRTDLLFAVSGSCADELARAHIAPRSRFTVVPPAVPVPAAVSRGEARDALGIPRADFRTVCIGRLVRVKRVADFVAAVALCDGVAGDVFGDGPLRAEIAAAAERDTGGRVLCRGANESAASLLAAYDALVLPSIREGFPLVAVEAFAAGVPVVGYDVPGVRDALEDGRGVLVPVSAGPRGLAAAIQRLRADPQLAAACVGAGRASVGAFAPAVVGARLLDAYRSIAIGKAAAAAGGSAV
ncbi:MAG: glycosyltransferase family 4 protein [Planctomycetes bacterium]|nr:glycosyltransferase family 4 protein [Planctomycetota bacterium]